MTTVSPVYPDNIVIEYWTGINWFDISSYVVSDLIGDNGINGTTPTDKISSLGHLTFDLNNSEYLFSPMGGDLVRGLSTLIGWTKGAKLRVRLLIEGIDKVIWAGWIITIGSDDGTWGNQRCHVVATDWSDIANKYYMKGSQILVNQKIDNAMNSIVARISVPPYDTDFDAGDEQFVTVFDNVNTKTKAITEIQKLAFSELSFIYLKQDGTLKVENSSARKGTRTLDKVRVQPSFAGALLWDNGGQVALQENGDVILLDQVEDANLVFSTEKLDLQLIDDVINQSYVNAYPTRVDTSLKTVYNLRNDTPIAGKSTITFRGSYVDPSGGKSINATNLQTPVANTDYKFYTGVSGTGSDITADLTVTATYYGDVVDYSVYNNNTSLGYLNFLTARGYGIYRYDMATDYYSNTGSMSAYGDNAITLDQKYKNDTYAGLLYGHSIVEWYKNPKTRVRQANFLANLNSHQMMAFVYLDVGSLVQIYENRSQISKYYYIMQRSFTITASRVIHFTYKLIEAPSLMDGSLTPVTLDTHAQSMNFGYIPKISGLIKRSISVWAYFRSADGHIANLNNDGGWQLAVGSNNVVQWYQKDDNGLGEWETASGTIPLNTWLNVVMTRDRSTDLNAGPNIYINNVDMTLTQGSVPTATAIQSEIGLPFYVDFGDAMVKDIRIYDDILTQSQRSEIYGTGTPNYLATTDNMVFQSFFLDADLGTASDLEDTILPSDTTLFDNVYRIVGNPNIGTGLMRVSNRTFSLQHASGTVALEDIAWSPELGLFAACGYPNGSSSSIQTSPNGINWTPRTSAPTGTLTGICWSPDKSLFVAVGQGSIYTSPDGVAWTGRTSPAAYNWYGVCWSHELGIFVATAYYAGGTTNHVMTSSNGIAWTLRDATLDAQWVGVAWSPTLGMFAAVSNNTTNIMTSTDGTNWNVITVSHSGWYGICWSPELGMFVSLSSSGYSIYSTDGVNWTESHHVSAIGWRRIAWSPELGLFMGVSYNGGTSQTFEVSADGIHWSTFGTISSDTWYGICWSPALHKFVIVGQGSIYGYQAMIY